MIMTCASFTGQDAKRLFGCDLDCGFVNDFHRRDLSRLWP